jgi:hypothetical protein
METTTITPAAARAVDAPAVSEALRRTVAAQLKRRPIAAKYAAEIEAR